jgi:beta-galactosidase
VDEHHVLNPYAENRIHYFIDGPARILSLESGNPVNTENNLGTTSRAAFFGLGRAFLQTLENEGSISAVIGAICGEPQLLTSKTIHIDVQSCSIRGESPQRNLKVLYSIDGSEPRTPYAGGFEIKPGTTVKAAVYDGDVFLFNMEERFAPGLGLYWGEGPSAPQVTTGDQAEDAAFSGATVKRSGSGFNGKGFLDFGHTQGSVEWYQENDGPPSTFTLQFRYSGKVNGRDGRAMMLSVNGVESELFFKNTANWGKDWKTQRVDVKLISGANRIKLSTIGSGGMYLDELIVK